MFRLLDYLRFALERLWQHRILALWALIGLAVAATLALSLPLYVDAVNSGLLEARLEDPPYAFRFRYLGSWEGAITPQDVSAADAVIQNTFTAAVDLPVGVGMQYTRGGTGMTNASGQNLGAFGLATLQGADAQMQIVAGEWPPQEVTPDVVPVLAAENVLYRMGVQVGDQLTVNAAGRAPLTVEVAALWSPVWDKDPNWIFTTSFFDDVLLMAPDDLQTVIADVEAPIEEAAWWLVFEGGDVRTSDITGLLDGMADGQRDVLIALPGTRVDVTPEANLRDFQAASDALTQQLILVLLPVAGLVLYFVSLVSDLLVSRQTQEDVTLRSRGMSRAGLMSIHLLMWLFLAGLALLIGVAATPFVVQLVGRTTSFLEFNGTEVLTVTMTSQALSYGIATVLMAASSGLWAAWRSSRQTITSFKQQSARARQAWWQRIYLDLILVGVALYVLYSLTNQGGLVTEADDPFSDPLIFLGPTLFSLGMTMLLLRVWPFILGLVGRFVAYGSGMALVMSLRELTRSIGRYRGALLMTCFTLSLTGYTASMASTMDLSLVDTINYQIGADAALVLPSDAQTEENADAASTDAQFTVVGYNTPPTDDLYGIEGVVEVTEAGRYQGQIIAPSQRVEGTILGVDRATMAAITRWREDYADEHIADLFNKLAGNRTGILLDRATLETYNFAIGQEIELDVFGLGVWNRMTVPIMGVLDYFPTLNPADGFFLVMNIDPIFETVGTSLPYNIWLSLTEEADPTAAQTAVAELGFPVLEWQDPVVALDVARAAPSRRGVLGFLSVGFVAAIVLTLIGAIIQNTASFRAQATQLGALRAMGMGSFTVAIYLILVLGISALSGILGGTVIGVLTTNLFLPLFDFSGGLPPYLVRVAWDEIIVVYGVFAGVLFMVSLAMTLLLGRQNVTALVKLGDV